MENELNMDDISKLCHCNEKGNQKELVLIDNWDLIYKQTPQKTVPVPLIHCFAAAGLKTEYPLYNPRVRICLTEAL